MAFSFQVPKLVIALLMILGTWVSQAMPRSLNNEEAIVNKYEKWMAEQGRIYQDNAEKEKRFQIFKSNLAYIENFNSAFNKTYKLGLNKFSDMTTEEFLAAYTGFQMPSTANTSTATKLFNSNDYNQDEVPENKDWRNTPNVVTSIKNQQRCGCCWAFSAAAAVEGLAAKGVSYSAQQLLDCVSTNQGCLGGTMNRAFQYIIENSGIASESDYPYQGSESGTCQSTENALFQISDYNQVGKDEESLKRAVAQQPVSVGIDAHNFKQYGGGVFMAEDCGNLLNHAVTAIGYGTSDDGSNFWLIKNSWGADWGENGYMKLQRDVGYSGGACGIALQASYPV